jgi:hypothetical protein
MVHHIIENAFKAAVNLETPLSLVVGIQAWLPHLGLSFLSAVDPI